MTKEVNVIIRHKFPANVERLWKAFTDAEDMLKWHSPVGMTNPKAQVDLRVGGNYSITMEYNDTGEQVTVRGEYKNIERHKRLVYTWKWDSSDMNTLVTVEFHKITNKETEIILTHQGFDEHPKKVDLDNNWTKESHNKGWTTAFTKLEELTA